MDARVLWKLPPHEFNQWRRKNDYPLIFATFEKKLPHFEEWMRDQKLSKELIFEHGIARFVSSDEPLILCTYVNNGVNRLFNKSFKKIHSIKKAGWITKTHEYQPYFYWLKKNYGENLFAEIKRNFIITSWINGRPQFMKEFFLTNLGGVKINAPILSGRLLDFTCLDNLIIIGAINNTPIYLWHCSAIGTEISGSVAFLYFYRTKLWDHGYAGKKRELKLCDGIFQDFHFKDCDLRFHSSRSTLMMWTVEGCNFDATLEHTDVIKSTFCAGDTNFISKKEFYAKVKILYSSIGRYADAGEYYFKEKVYEMLTQLEPHKSFREEWVQKNIFQKIFFGANCYFLFFINFLNYLVWGFGEKPFRCLLASLFVIMLSTVVFLFNSSSVTQGDFLNSLYFSIVTFVTLGYGDIAQKTPFLKIFSSIEAISGMVLMGLFLAGYASKSKQY